jgi:outer membrane protein OmpA-like peptidoglycan-associated protein
LRALKISAIILLIGCAGSKFKNPNEIDPSSYVCQETFAKPLPSEELSKEENIRRFSVAIAFRTATSELLPESKATLDSIAKYLKKNGKPYYVAVHTDMIGPPERLKELSRERAIIIVKVLESAGVDSNILFPVGVGFRCFIGNANNNQDQRKNRRIEFIEK